MDLYPLMYPAVGARFPRPRGDGPQKRLKGLYDEAVSPPTQGWTQLIGGMHRSRLGFPAHAGMDRSTNSIVRSLWRFPRPRGDGPRLDNTEAGQRTVSPPTRGWTYTGGLRTTRQGGFPAHAGMDLQQGTERLTRGGFPRPRGDGPGLGADYTVNITVSPPTRGWT